MQALDLFLLPSFWEGQALAMLQAISCELPVLASRIEGNTAILGSVHPGLFEPDDHGKLADLLQAAFQSGSVLSPLRSSVEVPTCRNAAEHLKQIYWDIAS
jgi:glycosyltransferase involved in cell wall biosynthesis